MLFKYQNYLLLAIFVGIFVVHDEPFLLYETPSSEWCTPKRGLPGAVYICPKSGFKPSASKSCEWIPPDEIKCHSWGEDESARPRSIGPDAGGYCSFYGDTECKDLIRNPVVGANSWGCPGIFDTGVPHWFKSIRCGDSSLRANLPT
ncbi:hypothetical protein BDW02DRAFT_601978 [Decorospora gaudefroyi]|uniref:Secreted protein n=1 Tax=Decorospora gaudefroyi TaxID=184978 RepID=A0A6A5K5M6_9PLEO|nr:hypothetical protein BDW02DRAFT_601978 [Decorospora gaudefroyi]